MADLQSPKEKYREPNSSFFMSPRQLFTPFSGKHFGDSDTLTSPASIFDTKSFPTFTNPFCCETNSPPKSPRREWEPKGVGLGLVDALIDDEKSKSQHIKCETRMVLFGSQLKIQIPPIGDFGILTKNLNSSPKKSPFGSSNYCLERQNPPNLFSSLSASEMELSEDYTCVISYGPNPKTTHIFGDCIVESCCGVVRYSESKKESDFFTNSSTRNPFESFLSSCHTCNHDLGLGKDIYMYRQSSHLEDPFRLGVRPDRYSNISDSDTKGEKAYCSSECRDMEMKLEEKSEFENGFVITS